MNWFWPKIIDVQSARKARIEGIWVACFCAFVTSILAIMNLFNIETKKWVGMDVSVEGLLDVLLFLLVAWGIYKFSRIAAVAGLVLYLYGTIDRWLTVGPKNPFIALLFTLAFINAIRGIFIYHRLTTEKPKFFPKRAGLISVITSIIGSIWFVILILTYPDQPDTRTLEQFGSLFLMDIFICGVGLMLAIGGLYQKTERKIFSICALALNGVIVLIFGSLLFLR